MRYILIILVFLSVGANAQMVIKAHANYRPFAQPAANLLLDDYPNAAAAYSLRKLDKDYTGAAIRVRKDTTGQPEQDIGFTASGDLDTVGLKNFLLTRSGFVTTWYDQSGNGRNASQATQANQPRIANLGVIDRANSKPTIQFNSNFLQLTMSGIDTSTYLQTFNVINPAVAATADVSTEALWSYAGGGSNSTLANRGLSWGYATGLLTGEKFNMSFSNASIDAGRLGTVNYTRNANTTVLHTTVNCSSCATGNTAFSAWYLNGDVTTRTLELNTTPSPTFNQETNASPSNAGTTSTTIYIKSINGLTNTIAQKYSELIMYNRIGESGRLNGVRTNINTYYSIY